MRWVWVTGSAAAACAVVTVALFLGDLETLSWIAGAGSFIIAAPSLVVALTHPRSFDQRTHTFEPAAAAEAGGVRSKAPGAAGDEGLVIVELTTPRIRITKRLASALKGAGIAVLTMWLGLAAEMLLGEWPGKFTVALLLELYLFIGVIMAVILVLTEAEGKDLLIVDDTGLTVIDKRWIRARDASFSIPWTLVRRIRLAVQPSGAFHALVVEFKYAKADTAERAQIDALEKRGKYVATDSGYIMARLYLVSGGAERTALLVRTRAALARFGRNAYSE